jgi:hypothetical protein
LSLKTAERFVKIDIENHTDGLSKGSPRAVRISAKAFKGLYNGKSFRVDTGQSDKGEDGEFDGSSAHVNVERLRKVVSYFKTSNLMISFERSGSGPFSRILVHDGNYTAGVPVELCAPGKGQP